jgi:hypothetical protein
LTFAKTPETKALGWFLLADVFQRQQQPQKVTDALKNARMHASAAKRQQP